MNFKKKNPQLLLVVNLIVISKRSRNLKTTYLTRSKEITYRIHESHENILV